MTTDIRIYCDRCGEQIKHIGLNTEIRLCYKYSWQTFEYCPNCTKDLETFAREFNSAKSKPKKFRWFRR